MIEWSLDAFRAVESVRSILVAAPPGHDPDLRAGVRVVAGGAARAQSVANALAAVGTELVAIHDAARPLLTAELIEALVGALEAKADIAGVIAATPVTDTIKRVVTGAHPPNRASARQERAKAQLEVERTLDRTQLWAAQTPQVFRTEALRTALAVDDELRDAATDEAMLVEAAGGRVLIHHVAVPNFKVTTPLDLRLAEQLLVERSAAQ